MKTLNFEQLVNVLNDNNIRFGAITKDGELIFPTKVMTVRLGTQHV